MNFINTWLIKIVGKKLADKIGLQEGSMNDSTVWYKSKGKLAAIIGAVLAAIGPVSTAIGHPIVIPTWVLEVLGAIGLYGIRDAIVTK
jgi:hypothetical protein